MLQIIMAVLSGVGVLLLGYYFMGRIDCFLSENIQSESEGFPKKVDCIVYLPDRYVNSFVEELRQHELVCSMLYDPYDFPSTDYRAAFALSGSDLDNLLVCNKAKHYKSECFMAAKCNSRIYMDLYRKAGVTVIIDSKISERTVEEILKGWKR